MSKRLYIFDLDGVLVDTAAIHTNALRTAVRELVSEDASKFRLLEASNGLTTREKLKYLNGLIDFDIDQVDARKRELTLEGLESIQRSHMADYLPLLIQHGKLFALASNSRREFVDIIVEKLGLTGYFHVIVAGDEVINPKPDPEIFNKVIQKMGMKPSDAVVFEDSDAGIVAARKAKVGKIIQIDPAKLIQPKDFLL